MLLLAHRGASKDAPENTIEAFVEAVRQEADGVELDAMVCGSGEVVVCHDEFLDRLARKPWEVRTTSLWKLRTADVGTPLGFKPARIPTLESVIDALPSDFLINIELKCERLNDDGLSEKVCALVRRMGIGSRVVISSFNPLCLFRVAASYPELRRGFLIDPDKGFLFQRGVLTPLTSSYSVHPYYAQVSEQLVREWRASGLEVACWTVDDPVIARSLRDFGVRYCITNRPGALRSAL
ncbi:MAG: glycerophosphodiester phosphodiesterase [Myxococcaceae bacterium]